MTSAALTDILCASSATVIVSGIETSRTVGSTGITGAASLSASSRPWFPWPFGPPPLSGSARGVAARLQSALLLLLFRPARRQLAALDFLDARLLFVLLRLTGLGLGLRSRLVQRAGVRGRLRRLRDLLWRRHHCLDRGDLFLDGATSTRLRVGRFLRSAIGIAL